MPVFMYIGIAKNDLYSIQREYMVGWHSLELKWLTLIYMLI